MTTPNADLPTLAERMADALADAQSALSVSFPARPDVLAVVGRALYEYSQWEDALKRQPDADPSEDL